MDAGGEVRLRPAARQGPGEGQFTLVDPLGNLMMRFPVENDDPKGMLEDIKKLLRLSRIG